MEDFQYKGYKELYAMLEAKGYSFIYVFDNFGNLVTEERDFKTLRNLNSYLYSMRKRGCTRTLYYTDVLAATKKNHSRVLDAVNSYREKWINRKAV